MQVAKDSMAKNKDTLYMKRNVRGSESFSVHVADSPNSTDYSPNGSRSPASSGLLSTSYEELVNKYCFVRTPGLHFNLKVRCPSISQDAELD